MWFLGLLAGLVVGAMVGHGAGAVIGAILGAIGGAVYRANHPASRDAGGEAARRLAEIERKLDHIYKSLEDIHWRLVKLEKPATGDSPVSDATVETADVQPEVASPSQLSSVATARADAASVSVAAPVETAPAAAPVTAQSIGLESTPEHVRRLAEEVTRAEAAAPSSAGATSTEPVIPHVAPAPATAPTSTVFATVAEPETPEEPPTLTLWQRLLSGNIVAKVGAVILFFGVGFLLKYAYDHAVLPVPVRLAGVAMLGFVLLFTGWRLSSRRRLYGLILQGAGIGVLYLDVFFALRVFALINPVAGFTLFMLLGVAATLLAVRQDAKVLAVIGLTGAFLAPVLASSGSGQHVVLFSYYTLLNAFVLAISWFKSWRDLNLTGFIFTFVVGMFWGRANYQPELFATVEPFVLIFFAMYLVIPILFATRQPPQLKGLVDGTLVFGTPLSVAFMQAGLVRDLPYGLAWSATVGAALYALLAVMVFRRDGMRLLGEAYTALSVVFATMAVFFALDAYPTFALWTLEGAAIVWVGLRQQRLLARLFGVLLQFGGAFLFMLHYGEYDRSQPWFNDFVLGCGLIATAGALTAWLMHWHRKVVDAAGVADGDEAATALLVWAGGWWFAGGLHALYDGMPAADFHGAALIFAAASFAAAETVGGWLAWRGLRLLTLAHLPFIALAIFGTGGRHPLAGLGAVAWPLSFAVFFWCVHWQARDGLTTVHGARYRFGWLLMALLATWEALWLFGHRHFGWSLAMGALGIAAGALRYRLRERDNVAASAVSVWALVWGLGFWFASALAYIERRYDPDMHIAYGLGFAAGSCLLAEIFGASLQWAALRRTQLLLWPAFALALILQIERQLHPFADEAWLAWAAGIGALFYILRRQQHDAIAVYADAQYVPAVWLATGLVGWELAWQCRLAFPGSSWAFAMWGAVPALALIALTRYGTMFEPWRDNFAAFRTRCLGPLAVFAVLWSLKSGGNPADSAPWLYLPFANPVDLAQIAILFALHTWLRTAEQPAASRTGGILLLAALGFIWINCIVLRSIHHWAGVPYDFGNLFDSILAQAALSILWTLTALVVMVLATRTLRRPLWLTGAALLALVVGKLFLLDLANSGTVERIVSFLAVGGLLMVIGYAAPVPPGDAEAQTG
jgi:uncharacterized membrane protein